MTRAPIPLPGQTVAFDYGEVISLTPSPADGDVITRLAGSAPTASRSGRAYFAHRDGLDQGRAGVAAYWQAIAGDTRLALLSNAGPDFGSYFRHGPLGDFFTACGLGGVRPRKLLPGCRAASRVAGRSCRGE